jgi:hypothetical protein
MKQSALLEQKCNFNRRHFIEYYLGSDCRYFGGCSNAEQHLFDTDKFQAHKPSELNKGRSELVAVVGGQGNNFPSLISQAVSEKENCPSCSASAGVSSATSPTAVAADKLKKLSSTAPALHISKSRCKWHKHESRLTVQTI